MFEVKGVILRQERSKGAEGPLRSTRFPVNECGVKSQSLVFPRKEETSTSRGVRKKISGAFTLCISFRRWTVMGFPNPQQFQLATTKEPGVEDCENPSSSLT